MEEILKKILSLLSLVLVLAIPLSLVSADSETVNNLRVDRNSGTNVISWNEGILKTSTSNSAYCVNLLYCLTSSGEPVNIVNTNHLVFRPYTLDNYKAANYVDFWGTYCNGENRRYGSYIYDRGGQMSRFRLMRSLNSDSTASYIDYSLRWNP